jgi:thiol-disulfide isomerase/thioredoxin/tetratricopeptide (TPR) repeat protein
MRLFSWPALPVLFAATMLASPCRAATPAIPDDLKPKQWKPSSDMKRLLDDFENVQDQTQLAVHIQKVEPTLAAHNDWIDLNRHYIGITRLADRWTEVQPRYRELAMQDTSDATLLFYLGLFERGAAGEPLFRRALTKDPGNYYAKCGLALALLQGNPPNSEEAFNLVFSAIRDRPDHPYGWQALALAYEISRDYDNAIRVRGMEQIVEPESFQPVNYIARDYQQIGKGEEGTAAIEAFVKKAPKNRNALRALIQAYKGANRNAEAIQAQMQIAEIVKNDGDEAYNLAAMLASNNEAVRAKEWLKKAVDRGFDDHMRASSDSDLMRIREDSTYFSSIIAEMKLQHEKKKPERTAKLIASLIDRPAPAFTLKTLDGRDMKLDGLKGKVVVLDFWATWCGPCMMTLPLVANVHRGVQGKPVEVLCMNVWERDAERSKVAPFWKDKGFPMTVGLASVDDAKSYEVTGIPTLFVIDQNGRMRYRHVGYAQYMDEEVLAVIDHLLANAKAQ